MKTLEALEKTNKRDAHPYRSAMNVQVLGSEPLAGGSRYWMYAEQFCLVPGARGKIVGLLVELFVALPAPGAIVGAAQKAAVNPVVTQQEVGSGTTSDAQGSLFAFDSSRWKSLKHYQLLIRLKDLHTYTHIVDVWLIVAVSLVLELNRSSELVDLPALPGSLNLLISH